MQGLFLIVGVDEDIIFFERNSMGSNSVMLLELEAKKWGFGP